MQIIAEAEIMQDGTLHIAVNADISQMGRVLVTQKGTQYGSLYYADAQAEPHWIPWNSGKFPEESGTYTVTAYDGVEERVTFAKYQKRLKRWDLTGARAYWRILAYKPLPEPWRGEEHGQSD